MTSRIRHSDYASPATASLAMFLQVIVVVVFLVFSLESDALSLAFLSLESRDQLVLLLGGTVRFLPTGNEVTASLPGVLFLSTLLSLLVNTVSLIRNRFRPLSMRYDWGWLVVLNSLWVLPLLLWNGLWMASFIFPQLMQLAAGMVNLAVAATLTGWMCRLLLNHAGSEVSPDLPDTGKGISSFSKMLLAMGLFVTIFTCMNWALWWNLRIPHGDSAMYEEHLWNLSHGKGFRSYLDQGLFLGEHIQVIHLFLLPIHWVWPSHLVLELSETVALALGTIPTFYLARKRCGNDSAAMFIAFAYLLYFPMHYLDIAIDLKTFRPISFGIPILLWGILSLEHKRWKQMTVAFLFALASKEDYAIVIAPLGVWILWNEWREAKQECRRIDWNRCLVGCATVLLATTYLLFVVKFAIPWFRNWETVHYARYFEEFGNTPTEIVLTMLTRPQLLFTKLVTVGSILYFLRLLFPLSFPVRGWSELLAGAPLFVLLCLNNIAMQPPVGPYHHFHAPLIPILIWATCAATGATSAQNQKRQLNQPQRRAIWIFCCAFVTSILFGFSPLSIRFWDPGQEMYWRKQYVPDERARQVENVLQQIPSEARVAATDYVHARLTHFERSYDYSDYPRAVANYEDKVPDDTDFIVIDRKHKHSLGKYDDLSSIRELQRHPEDWEVLPDRTAGYFFILKRRNQAVPQTE